MNASRSRASRRNANAEVRRLLGGCLASQLLEEVERDCNSAPPVERGARRAHNHALSIRMEGISAIAGPDRFFRPLAQASGRNAAPSMV